MTSVTGKLRVTLIVLVVAGSVVIPFGLAIGEEEFVRPATFDCTFDLADFPKREQVWRDVSRETERFSLASTSGRRRGVTPPEPVIEPANFIDEQIFGKMREDGIKPTRLTTDEEFVRRATLALTGDIPTPTRVIEFLVDERADKRNALIDELLASEGYVNRWTMWFGDLVQNVSFASNIPLYPKGMLAYHEWIRESIATGKPYDQMVQELIGARGDSFLVGEANYVVRQIQSWRTWAKDD